MFPYYYVLPIILAVLISSWVSFRLAVRYAAMYAPGTTDNPHEAVHDMTPLTRDGSFVGVLIGVSVCLIAAAVAIGLIQHAAQATGPRPNHFLIPQGYIGLIEVDFDQVGAPPIPITEGYDLFVIPPNGLLKTSSSPEAAASSENFYYYAVNGTEQALKNTGEIYPGSGLGGMIWEEGTHPGTTLGGKATAYGFFVGTQAQYDKYGVRVPQLTVGPIKQ